MLLSRRTLITAASLTALPTASWAQGLSRGAFSHGVASGDPLQDSVILWTRFVPSGDGRIAWEVAEDEAFTRVARRGRTRASFDNDFCVHVEVSGLLPGRLYFYRFLSGADPSPTGVTRTAPAGRVDRFTFALASCSHFGFGYFHACGHIAQRDDIEIVLHVGDYIYEIRRGVYPDPHEAVAGRTTFDPVGDTVTLSDYYQRYASYHTDPDLLEMRRLKPICAVWDDHEIANDAWREGAAAHNSNTQGAYADRVAAASKAFHDWLPIRRFREPRHRQYRSFDWGDLARVVMLDTRFIGRDRELDYRALHRRLGEAGADAQALLAQFRSEGLDNPARSLLGAPQQQWIDRTLAQSKASGQPWQVIAQQVILGEQKFGPELTRLLPENTSAGSRDWIARSQRLAELGISWNPDAWDGYGASRAHMLETCLANANNALVLAGDSHNCWLNNIPGGGRNAAVEFAGGSITSPGFERTMSAAQPGEREAAFRSANPELAFCDIGRRGYGALSLTREGCASEWVSFDDVKSPNAGRPRVTRVESAASAGAGPGAWTVAG